MRCIVCKMEERAPNVQVSVCWCGVDLCTGCLDRHGRGCRWWQAMRIKREQSKHGRMRAKDSHRRTRR